MRATLSQIKEQQRKQIAVKDKLVYLQKAPNGEIIEVHLLQWVAEGFIEELQKQAELNRQQYEAKLKLEKEGEEQLLVKKFELVWKYLETLQEEVKALKHEIAIIKGEEE